jgi:hypothetical protein
MLYAEACPVDLGSLWQALDTVPPSHWALLAGASWLFSLVCFSAFWLRQGSNVVAIPSANDGRILQFPLARTEDLERAA